MASLLSSAALLLLSNSSEAGERQLALKKNSIAPNNPHWPAATPVYMSYTTNNLRAVSAATSSFTLDATIREESSAP